jgi:hypothetical protein
MCVDTCHTGVSINGGIPQNGWPIRENLIEIGY